MALFLLLPLPTQHTQSCWHTGSLAHTLPGKRLSYTVQGPPLWKKKRTEPPSMHAGAWSMVTDPGCRLGSPSQWKYQRHIRQRLLHTRGHSQALPVTVVSVFLEQARGRGNVLLDAAGCMAQGTLEQFPVRHERVQLKALGWGLGGREAGLSSIHIWENTWPHPPKGSAKGRISTDLDPIGVNKVTFTYANGRQGLFHHR